MYSASPSKGYFVYFGPQCDDLLEYTDIPNVSDGSQSGHTFCGLSTMSGTICPNCKRPFTRYMELDSNDQKLDLNGSQISCLEIMYCFRCGISNHSVTNESDLASVALRPDVHAVVFLSGSYLDARPSVGIAPFYYQAMSNGISLVQYRIGSVQDDFPYANYPDSFPESQAKLLDISISAQQVLQDINSEVLEEWDDLEPYQSLDRPRHQVGGEPYLSQHDTGYEMICPLCSEIMPFLYGTGDECLDPRGITGNEYVQILFHYCRACSVVGGFNQV